MKTPYIPNGTYHADIVNYGLMETKSGNITAYIKVSLDFGGNVNNMIWFGGIKNTPNEGKTISAREYTLKTFNKLYSGFNFDWLVDREEKGDDKAHLIGTEVSVVVLNETNPKTGESSSRIKYVNPVAGKFKKIDVKKLSSLREGPDLPDTFEEDLPF